MAKTIALEIEIDGVPKLISSIKDFEKELEKVKAQLGIIGDGADIDVLSQEINGLTQDFEALVQNIQDVDFTETMDEFTQLSDTMTQSFSDASGAIQEFGNDTDIVAEQAQRALAATSKSTNTLSGSLTDLGDKFSQIPGPIGQVAQGVKGLGQAFKILIANPVGLVLAAIALALTTLYKAFTSTKAGAETMERAFAALGAVVDVIRDRFLKFVDAIVSLLTLDISGFVNNITGAFKGVGKEIAEEAKQAAFLKGQLQQLTDQARELNKERARQNVLIADAKLKINDENLSYEERLKALEEVRKAEIKLVQQEQDLAQARFDAIKAQNALSDSSKEALDEEAAAYVELQNKILQSKTKQKELFDQEKALRDRQKAEQKAALDERIAKEKEQADKRKAQIEEQKKAALDAIEVEIKGLEKLRFEISKQVEEPAVITQLKAIRAEQQALASVFDKPTFAELFKKQFEDVIPPLDAAADAVDAFGAKYTEERKKISEAALLSPDAFKKQAEESREVFFNAFQTGEITGVALDAFDELLKGYEKLNQTIFEDKFGIFNPDSLFLALRDYKVATGKITQEIVRDADGKIVGISRSIFRGTAKEAADAFEVQQKFVLMEAEDYYRNLEGLKEKLLPGEEIEAGIKRLAQEYLNTVLGTSDAIIQQEQIITKFYAESFQEQEQRRKEGTKAQLGFLAQNIDLVLTEITDTVGTAEGLAEETFQKLVMDTINYTELTEEEIANLLPALSQLYKQFYDKLKEQRDEDVADEKAKLQKKKESILNFAQEATGLLSSIITNITDIRFLALESLEKQNEAILAGIQGDTEEANQQRLEQQQIYEAQRKEIEKSARLTELRFALGQAVVEGAIQVIRAASNPILAALTAGVAATQIAVINTQIAQVQSLQRGGMTKRQNGGFIVDGPSHEYGGVKFQMGGYELEGGEAVLNRVSSTRFNDLLSNINQAGGGVPFVNSGFDDTRILEALAKQRSEPIRAYVLEQEITNKQAVNQRLESLSTL